VASRGRGLILITSSPEGCMRSMQKQLETKDRLRICFKTQKNKYKNGLYCNFRYMNSVNLEEQLFAQLVGHTCGELMSSLFPFTLHSFEAQK
jgi:hypothetical protein